jgi:2'-5' RNA ligase
MPKDDRELVRTFVAIEIPEAVKAAMDDVQAVLRKTGADVGWVRPSGIHLTLKFLGGIEAGRVEELKESVGSAVRGHGPFALDVSGVGVFPNARAPRVVWMGVGGDLPALAALYEMVETACESIGFRREDRPFKPHLTLGRVKSPGGRNRLMDAITGLDKATAGTFTADAVSIMKSELRPTGAVYTEMYRAGL